MTALTTNVLPMVQTPRHAPAWRGIPLRDMDTALRFCKGIAASGFAPKSYYANGVDPVAAIFAAVQLGAEVGLSPMASIQNIAIINGRPGMFGPAMLAVVEASGLLADIDEGVEGEGDDQRGYCTVTRVGRKPRPFAFSVRQAKKAGLWGKAGPWSQYPERMLVARARTFALRDTFPDVLMGLSASVEELQDTPPDGKAIDLPRLDEPELAPKVKQIEVVMPGDMSPEYFPQTGPGIEALVKFVMDTVLDGGAGVALLNVELLDKLAKFDNGRYADDVEAIRDTARKALTSGGDEPEPEEGEGE